MARLKSPQQVEAERQAAKRNLLGNYALPTDRLLLVYARQSSKFQVINNRQAALQQTEDLILRGLDLEWKRGDMLLFVENYFTKEGKRTEKIRSVSGTMPIEDRPGLRTIVDEYVKTGKAGAIICYDVSRLTRDADLVDAVLLAKVCKNKHVVIITNDTVYDFNNLRNNDLGMFIDEAKAAAAFVEKHIKGKVLAARTRKAEKDGLLANGVAPIGLMSDKKPGDRAGNNLLPSPHAPYVNGLYERFLELNADFARLYREVAGTVVFPDVPGIDPRTIYLTRVEGGWTIGSRTGLKRILVNMAYDGHLVFNGRVVKRNAHQAIVEHEVWQFAFDNLSDTDVEGNPIDKPKRAVRFNQRGNYTDALLAGVRNDGRPVIEGKSGYGVYVYVPNARRELAYCLKRSGGFDLSSYAGGIDADEIDRLFVERLMLRLELQRASADHAQKLFGDRVQDSIHGCSMAGQMEAFSQERTKPADSFVDAIEEAQKELARVTRRVDVAEDLMSNAELREAYASKARLTKRVQDLEDRQKREQATRVELVEARKDCENARCQWGEWDIERRRRFIRLFTESITLEKLAEGWLVLTIVWCPFLGVDVDAVDTALIWQRAGSKWSDEEVATLRTHYPTATRGELLRMLPTRTWTSIKSKGKELRLRRPERGTALDTDLPGDMAVVDRDIIERYELRTNEPDKRVWWFGGGTISGGFQS